MYGVVIHIISALYHLPSVCLSLFASRVTTCTGLGLRCSDGEQKGAQYRTFCSKTPPRARTPEKVPFSLGARRTRTNNMAGFCPLKMPTNRSHRWGDLIEMRTTWRLGHPWSLDQSSKTTRPGLKSGTKCPPGPQYVLCEARPNPIAVRRSVTYQSWATGSCLGDRA